MDFNFGSEPSSDYTVHLLNPESAKLNHGSDPEKVGTWTMMYNQGMVVTFEDQRFITNFKYILEDPESSANAIGSLSVGSLSSFRSICSKTMIGVV